MIEREKETRGDPKREGRAWAATLSEAEHKREKYLRTSPSPMRTLL
jgi:hypothetical protein